MFLNKHAVQCGKRQLVSVDWYLDLQQQQKNLV